MLLDAKFWIVVAFVVFFLLLGRRVLGAAGKGLDARAATIAAELAQAEQLKAQAQALLDEYRTKSAQMQHDAERMISDARKQADAMIAAAEARAKDTAAKRLAQLSERLEEEQKQAAIALRNDVIDNAMRAATTLVQQHFASASNNNIITHVAEEIKRIA